MNYYIQGNKDKADKIKAAFEKLGYRSAYVFNAEMTLYFTFNGEIKTAVANSYKSIIKTHPDYKELELPVEPKFNVGDWIVATGKCVYLITKIDEFTVILVDVMGDKYEFGADLLNDATLWTVNDAKDGDVLVTTKIRNCPFIYRKTGYDNDLAYYYAGVDGNGDFCEGCIKRTLYHFGPVANVAPATKEQRDLLFAKMKEAGYEWDDDKKELRKIQPHYDISNFKAGMPVLVREYDTCHWQWVLYSHFNGVGLFFAAGKTWRQCIPFEGNETLLGTTDMSSKEYINW